MKTLIQFLKWVFIKLWNQRTKDKTGMWITLIFGLQKAFIICSRSTPRRVATFFPAVFSLSSGSHCSSLPFCLNFYNFKIWIYLYSNLERVRRKRSFMIYHMITISPMCITQATILQMFHLSSSEKCKMWKASWQNSRSSLSSIDGTVVFPWLT